MNAREYTDGSLEFYHRRCRRHCHRRSCEWIMLFRKSVKHFVQHFMVEHPSSIVTSLSFLQSITVYYYLNLVAQYFVIPSLTHFFYSTD